jgi:hypothetical protein
MELQEQHFDEKEAFKVVNDMIKIAQGNIYDSYFFFILWGWLSVIGGIAGYISAVTKTYDYMGWIWTILGLTGGLSSIIYGRTQDKKKKVTTILDKNIGYTWGAFCISGSILFTYSSASGQFHLINPIILILAGTSTFITGGLIKYRPLMFGALCLWIFGIATLLINSELQMLIASAGMILGYIIPGYMLKAKHKNETI